MKYSFLLRLVLLGFLVCMPFSSRAGIFDWEWTRSASERELRQLERETNPQERRVSLLSLLTSDLWSFFQSSDDSFMRQYHGGACGPGLADWLQIRDNDDS